MQICAVVMGIMGWTPWGRYILVWERERREKGKRERKRKEREKKEREREKEWEGEYGQLNGQKWEELDTKYKNIANNVRHQMWCLSLKHTKSKPIYHRINI